MLKTKKGFKLHHFIKHKTKHKALVKFITIFLTVIAYFFIIYLKYDFTDSLMITFLTWSFFVLCTPIADAGFLFDFPMRVFANIRMVYTECFVWFIAITLNLMMRLFNPSIYEKTSLLSLFHHILTNPIPFWLIIIISAIGTFMSVLFGDELVDVVEHRHRKIYHKHRSKYYWIIFIFIIVAIFVLYDYMIVRLGINI